MHQMPRADDAVAVVVDRSVVGGLGRRGTPHGPFRRFLRGFIHFFSYHLILARQNTRVTWAAGFRLTIRPTVFHPRYFISSECFAEFIGGLDLSGKHVVDIGTGSGILALAAARAGAENVIATDINPNAALTAIENARANGMDDCVTAVCTNLLSTFAPRPLFDGSCRARLSMRANRAISPIAAGTPVQTIATYELYSTSLASALSPEDGCMSWSPRIPTSICSVR